MPKKHRSFHEKFLDSLNSEAVRNVFAQYQQENGNLDALESVLWNLMCWELTKWDQRTIRYLRTHLRRCKVTLQTLLDLNRKISSYPYPRRFDLSSRLVEALELALEEISRELALRVNPARWTPPKRTQPGRPPTLHENLMLAVLDKEFYRHFERRAYKDILTLVLAVAPHLFRRKDYKEDEPDPESLGRRIRAFRKKHESLVTDWHSKFFG